MEKIHAHLIYPIRYLSRSCTAYGDGVSHLNTMLPAPSPESLPQIDKFQWGIVDHTIEDNSVEGYLTKTYLGGNLNFTKPYIDFVEAREPKADMRGV